MNDCTTRSAHGSNDVRAAFPGIGLPRQIGLCSRREFLASASVAGLALAGTSRASETVPRRRLSPAEVRAQIRGPILTLPTPFESDFSVDHAGIRRMIRLGLTNRIGVYELTAGNSMFAVLSDDEIRAVTQTMIDEVAGHGIVIAATGPWWTGQAVEFAKFAESAGADALQVFLPPGTEAGYRRHFRALAKATKLPLILQGALPLPLIEQLLEIPAIVGMKEDGTDEYYVELTRALGKRLAIFCGGQKRRYLLGQPHGSEAWFSFFITFAPEVANRFRKAIEAGDRRAAEEIVERYEKPIFEFCLSGPRSFSACWRGLLEQFGVAKRFVRPPDECCDDEDMKKLAVLCDRLQLARTP